MALSKPALAQAADMALRLGLTPDWKRKFISHFNLLGHVLFECIFVGEALLCVAHSPASERFSVSRGSGRALMKNLFVLLRSNPPQ